MSGKLLETFHLFCAVPCHGMRGAMGGLSHQARQDGIPNVKDVTMFFSTAQNRGEPMVTWLV